MSVRRVVVTGIGAVSSLGIGYEALREGLFSGRTGAAPIARFDASGLRVRVAAEVRDVTDEMLPSDPRHHRILNRPMRFGLVAAAEALADAGLATADDVRTTMACLMSLNRQDIHLSEFGESFARAMIAPTADETGYRFDRARFFSRGVRALHPLWLLGFIPNLAVAHISRTFDLRGEMNTYLAEAAAGLQLVGDAAQSIREGLYDVALCGGSDGRVDPVNVARYLALGILAEGTPEETDLSKPFDAARRGAVVGEGAGFLVLEEADHAARRGAPVLAEVIGWGGGGDAHHPVRAHPEGIGLRIAIESALRSADVAPESVDTVVAAAASMSDYDAAESTALDAVFGNHTPRVTAPAGALGRTFAAAGAFSAVVAVASLREQAVPPTANTTSPDRGSPSGLVYGNCPTAGPIRTVLANAVSLGGTAATAVFSEVRA
jgi:3-oxoacyl-[acyl-carrier-protein] synthase II